MMKTNQTSFMSSMESANEYVTYRERQKHLDVPSTQQFAAATQNASTAFTDSLSKSVCQSQPEAKTQDKAKFTNLFDIDYMTFKNIKKEFPEYGHLEGDRSESRKESERKKTIRFGLPIKEFMARIQKHVQLDEKK